MTDYTELAKEWLVRLYGQNVPASKWYDVQRALQEFATFLNERASREECDCGSKNGNHFTTCPAYPPKPQEKPASREEDEVILNSEFDEALDNWPQEKPCEHKTRTVREFCHECDILLREVSVGWSDAPKPTHSKALALEPLMWASGVPVTQDIITKLNELIRYVKELERKINP